MMIDLSTRSDEDEWMDAPGVAPDELVRTLDDLARLNARIGGHLPSIAGLEELGVNREKLTVLDVGTGDGDIPRRFADWARRREIELDVTGIELSAISAEHARRRCMTYPEIRVQQRDLFEMQEQRFDVVHASLMLHHLMGERAEEGLRRMVELSRLGVIINDLHRHPISYWGSFALLRLLSDNPMIHHDGTVSIARGFRRRELGELADRSGASNWTIRWWPLFRWQVVLEV